MKEEKKMMVGRTWMAKIIPRATSCPVALSVTWTYPCMPPPEPSTSTTPGAR